MSFKPLLASPCEDLHALRYPVLVSPKLDGIRCIVSPGGPVSRKLKPIPNRELFELFKRPELIGLDGELIAGPANAPNAMQRTSSAVMSHESADARAVTFRVFDLAPAFAEFFARPDTVFESRYQQAAAIVKRLGDPRVQIVQHERILSAAELAAYEAEQVALGFEGVMVRAPEGVYKEGRSTVREAILLKVKRFADDEGRVVAFEEQYTNENEKERDALGHAKRSTAAAGLKPAGVLGAVILESPKWSGPFRVGGGWTAQERADLWRIRGELIGKLCTFKHQPHGAKDAPRFPVFKAWRHPDDLT